VRILLLIRLYSGLERSIRDRIWRPAGVPTIYKLIEALDAEGEDYRVVFAAKGASGWTTVDDVRVEIAGIGQPVVVLAGEAVIPRWLGRFRWIANDLRQTWAMVRIWRRERPDLVYCDRSTAWAAGLLARWQRARTVVRLMGISPGLRAQLRSSRPTGLLTRWAFRAPFAAVVCTQDGSNAPFWLDRIVRPGVKVWNLLNGCDPADAVAVADPPLRPRTTVLFVGRLDPLKGCDEFVAAFLKARLHAVDRLRAVIIGDGQRATALRAAVARAGAEADVTFTGLLAHRDVLGFYRQADIYVSLNQMGNLSNANLEAMRAGCCVIFAKSDPQTGRDLDTDELLPPDTVYRIPSGDDVEALAAALLYLHAHPDERRARGHRIKTIADGAVRFWPERIAAELSILRGIASVDARLT
jgi:glycosyltransferase involved in cell wall biosynthesis